MRIAVAASAQITIAVVALTSVEQAKTGLATGALGSLILLVLMARSATWAWYAFVSVQAVGLAVIPVFVLLGEILPGGEFALDWFILAACVVSLAAVCAQTVRPPGAV